jgi:hypothetical protein
MGEAMTSSTLSSAIERRIRAVIQGYGKIALLVDDAPDAASRIARELYGLEALPEWWLLARSAECGAAAIEALLAALFEDGRPVKVPGFVLIDRFLPAHDDQEWATAWDVPKLSLLDDDVAVYRAMNLAVRRLRAIPADRRQGRFEWALITSYPHVPLESRAGEGSPDTAGNATLEGAEPLLPWQKRSSEVLLDLRPKLPRSLLHYGPEESQRSLSGVHTFFREEEVAWRAWTWRPSINALANALARQDRAAPVILFTGAGASLAQGSYGSGMPPTWWLLEEATRSLVHAEGDVSTGRLEQRDGGVPPRDLHQCCHVDDARDRRTEKQAFRSEAGVAPIDWLVDYLLASKDHRAYDLELGLDVIFSQELSQLNQRSGWTKARFYQYFRSHLERFDHGIPYHYWLFAQMPWTRIITTNFDSFHERAAFAAASDTQGDRNLHHERLALGCVLPEVASKKLNPEEFEKVAHTHRLFKPYGNLLSPAELLFDDTPTQMAMAPERIGPAERLRRAFRGLEPKQHGWLVVVGHSMKDRYITEALRELQHLKNFELLWVVPDAYRRCAPTNPGDLSLRPQWEQWVFERMKLREEEAAKGEPAHFSGPLPGTALEFAYDLWREYRQLLRVRAGN